ncbi:hypothetical protein FWK35_00022462 [Aphis craccivora]|uniref:Mos1 transposase HTH domain-containing protein n=1 Tax=Aphis craccivora TaxID=307492 RepID=A0A6G0YQP9_APHCR|nr:hypothetical protein FWK35_00022462 [Aphis craccivora]
MLKKAYGEPAMSKTRVYEWYKCFQDDYIKGSTNVVKCEGDTLRF